MFWCALNGARCEDSSSQYDHMLGEIGDTSDIKGVCRNAKKYVQPTTDKKLNKTTHFLIAGKALPSTRVGLQRRVVFGTTDELGGSILTLTL